MDTKENLNFYNVKIEYADFLRHEKLGDKHVPFVEYEKRNKFFIGVVLKIGTFNYFAPVTSYTSKNKTTFNIKDRDETVLASVRPNYMFPVVDGVFSKIDIPKIKNKNYRNLVDKEYRYCNLHREKICRLAERVYRTRNSKDYKPRGLYIINFKKLERRALQYRKGKPKIISIVGLTASGKSAIGIALAQKFNGEVISCDSRQVYKGLDIGTAKVTTEEMNGVPHHLLDIVEPPKTPAAGVFNELDFLQKAYAAIDDILARGKLPILVGGTGLYSRSVTEGYLFANEKLKMKNEKFRQNRPRYEVLQICLLPPKEHIAKSVEERIDKRLSDGMIEETKQLLANGVSKEWLQKLGLEYYWNIELIEGRITLEQYKYWLATKTMQYAKRQKTWFKKEKNTVFLTEPKTFYEDCEKLVAKFVKQ